MQQNELSQLICQETKAQSKHFTFALLQERHVHEMQSHYGMLSNFSTWSYLYMFNTRLLKKSLFVLLMMSTTCIYADSILSPITDTVNSGIISSKIALDSSLSNVSVNVNVDHGYVALSGIVNTEAEKQRVIKIAQSISGINGVDISRLKVRDSLSPLSDTEITAKIKTLFVHENLFGKVSVPVISISVTTNNGIVTLTGTADSQKQIDSAINIAKSVSGVKGVESQVTVQKP